jgi:iron(II)-dependent oxidoreductase
MMNTVRMISVLLATAILCLPAAVAEDAGDTVAIPGGPFVMGSDDGPADERPVHRVTLSPFMIDRVAVSNRGFAIFLNARGWKDTQGRRYYDVDDGDARIHQRDGRFVADPGYETHAAVEPTWRGARAYCRWRGKRLPTEAEWERAARGKDGRTYPWGEAAPRAVGARFAAGWNATVPVTGPEAGATPDGVLGLAGNTHEWTSSLYRDYPYRANDGRENPEASGERVTRGGAHDSAARDLRAAWRGDGVSRGPRAGHHNVGFRCARDSPSPP